LVLAGKIESTRRYIKTAGTHRVLDYRISLWDGASGSPILDAQSRWVGIHRRSLHSDFLESSTCFNFYLWYYYSSSFDEKKSCRFNGGIDLRQGSLMIDIVSDVLSRKGLKWIKENIPSWEAPAKKLGGAKHFMTNGLSEGNSSEMGLSAPGANSNTNGSASDSDRGS
jgi:hypothetical protein